MDKGCMSFLEEFDQPVSSQPADSAVIEKYRGKLPNQLLAYWEEYGWCGFKDGLFWIVNPDDYEGALNTWIGDTPIIEKDAYFVIARSGFGKLYVWGTNTGYMYDIDPFMGWIYEGDGDCEAISLGRADECVGSFFSIKDVEGQDIDDEDGNPLFARAIEKFGPLGSDEMFGFAPALALGGKQNLDSLTKVDIHVHLDLLAQLGEREILDREALTRKAFGG